MVIKWSGYPNLQNWLANAGVGAFFAQMVPGRPVWFHYLLGAITLICFVFSFRQIWEKTQNVWRLFWEFQENFRVILILLLPIIALTLLWLPKPDLPPDVIVARRAVQEIQTSQLNGSARKWWATSNQADKPEMTFFVKGECQLIVIESLDDQAQVLKTYVKDGKKVASDIHEKGLYPFVRRYYRSNGCNFATDYFDKSGNHSCLKYDKDCTGNTQVFQLSSPVFIPPVPLAYR